MTDLISPRLSKVAALALLALVLWVSGTLLTKFVIARIEIGRETADLRQSYEQLRSRRVDVVSLQAELAQIAKAPGVLDGSIAAASERAALARFQQSVRKRVQDAGGQLLSLNEVRTASAGSSSVAVQIRARVAETSLEKLIAHLEGQAPRVSLEEMVLTSRTRTPGEVGDVEATLVARTKWYQKAEETK